MTTDQAPALRTAAGLRAWRKSRGLSQQRLADLLEVQPLTIIRWEQERVAIPRTVELALLWLDQELPAVQQHNAEPALTATDRLVLELAAERGDDVSNPRAALQSFYRATGQVIQLSDIIAAAAGDVRARIRVRKAAGLRAIR